MKPRGITLIVVFAFLFVVALYYIFYSQGFNRQSSLVGDATCGSLVSESAQNNCCANVHADEIFQCAGEWKYNPGNRLCSYICGSSKLDSIKASSEFNKCLANLTSYYSNADGVDYHSGTIALGFKEGFRNDVLAAVSRYSLSVTSDQQSFVYIAVPKGDELAWACIFLVDSETASKVSFVEPDVTLTGSG